MSLEIIGYLPVIQDVVLGERSKCKLHIDTDSTFQTRNRYCSVKYQLIE